MMLRVIISASVAVLFMSHGRLSAEVTFDWATVGNPGNAPDQDYGDGQFGAVSYTYRISKHEVTNDQYAEFLNAVAATDNFGGAEPHLYNANMDINRSGSPGSFNYAVVEGFGPNPVNYVSFFDNMRFVNWLENGQGSGSTESGVYNIGTGNETRAASASFFIPSEDEWYKAAYYDPRSAAAGGPPGDDNYWLYPTQNDTAPSCVTPPGVANSANCAGAVGDTTDMGAYTNTTNFYGTFDQGGNVWERNETVIMIGGTPFRVLRGGSFVSVTDVLAASFRRGEFPALEFSFIGFRVASIPEQTVSCDFSGDGLCDVTDLDLMQSLGPITAGVPAAGNEAFDLNGDGTIDLTDRDQWLADAAAENSLGSPYKLGDANLDGFVDGTDFIAWNASRFTQSLLWSNGDFTADGFVDGTDFIEWNSNKFTSSDGVAAVPEPGIGVLLIGAVIGLAAALRRR